MRDNRPVNLDLTTISMPLSAIASILHRISGIAIFIGFALLLYLLDASLASPARFIEIKQTISQDIIVKVLVWLVMSGFIYHAVAGIRHMIMDLGFCESLEGGKQSAMVTVIASAVLIILAGVWLW